MTVTDATFSAEVERSPVPVLVDAWAPWCGPCRIIAPVIDELAAEMAGRIRVAKLNVDDSPATAARFGLRSIPTLLVLQGGREVDRLVGVQPKAEIVRRRPRVTRMVTEEQIAQLEEFNGGDAAVLSLYLDLDPEREPARAHRVVLDDLTREIGERLEPPACRALADEATRVRSWLDDEVPRGRGLAVFSCEPRGLWQAHVLPARIESHAAFEPIPDVAPLLDLLDEYERYAVALVDKARARLFTVFAGAIEEHDTFEDLVPPKHDQGGLSQANFQRHHEAHVYRHLARVADHLTALLRVRAFDRLILSGPVEATSELRRLLPRALAHRVVAVIPGELFASTADVLERTLEVERRIERESEERLLAELFELAGGGGRAVCGVAPTLEALWRGAVQVLVAADDVHGGGSDCPTCGRLEPGSVATCPSCGSTTRVVTTSCTARWDAQCSRRAAWRSCMPTPRAASGRREADSAPCCATGGDPRARATRPRLLRRARSRSSRAAVRFAIGARRLRAAGGDADRRGALPRHRGRLRAIRGELPCSARRALRPRGVS